MKQDGIVEIVQVAVPVRQSRDFLYFRVHGFGHRIRETGSPGVHDPV